jgi:hypothetical protein
VLGDVPEPGALLQALQETAAFAPGTGVVSDSWQQPHQPTDETWDGGAVPLLEFAEVDEQMNALLVGPDVWAAVDTSVEDFQGAVRVFGH